MTLAIELSPADLRSKLAVFAGDIKISHTVFAMPWAILAAVMAWQRVGGPDDGAAFEKAAEVAVGGEMRLGDHVVVSVLAVHGDEVRLGVQSPKHVRVERKERADNPNT